jgi:hypothetical protein
MLVSKLLRVQISRNKSPLILLIYYEHISYSFTRTALQVLHFCTRQNKHRKPSIRLLPFNSLFLFCCLFFSYLQISISPFILWFCLESTFLLHSFRTDSLYVFVTFLAFYPGVRVNYVLNSYGQNVM